MRTLLFAVVLCAVQLTAWADSAASTPVTVTGPGVGISQMNGGTVQTGLTQEEVAALTKATGEELVGELTRILERIFAKQRWVYRQSVSIGVVQAFLANVKGRNIPQDEWPQAFAELARQCLQLHGPEGDSATAASTEVRAAENKRIDGQSPVLRDVQEKPIIPAQEVGTALQELAMQAGWNVIIAQRDAHVRSAAVDGSLEPRAALAAMLVGTGLYYEVLGHNTVGVFRKRSKDPSAIEEAAPEHAVPTSSDQPNEVFGPDERQQLAGNSAKRGFSPSLGARIDRRLFTRDFCEEAMGDSSQVTRTNSTRGCGLDIRALGATAPRVLFDGQRLPPSGTPAMFFEDAPPPFNVIAAFPTS